MIKTMAPSALPRSGSKQTRRPESNIATIDVGGQLFQTTKQTLALAGPDSLLSKISGCSGGPPPFIDRDPELFSILLSLLRTGNLPSKAKSLDLHDLIAESRFYGIETLMIDSISNPAHFDAFSLEKSITLPLNGRDSPSAIATTPFGSVHVVHGSKITSFDWSLRKKATILTELSAVDSMLALSTEAAAIGATDFSGLQIVDLGNGSVRETLSWENVTRSGSTVQAIGSSQEALFVSFESGRRNSNSIMIYDLATMRPKNEIAHYEIFGAEINSALPATKLEWLPSYNLLMAAGSHSGPSGVSGNIKFWDVRTGNVAWEVQEKVDCFSDVTVSDELSAMFKISVNSGEIYYADLRSLSSGVVQPWVCLGDKRKGVSGKKEGVGCKIESHGSQVFCSKGGDLELWSEVAVGSKKSSGGGSEVRHFRKNVMGRMKDMGGSKVTNLAFGGNKMFMTRKDQQYVEVWQNCTRRY